MKKAVAIFLFSAALCSCGTVDSHKTNKVQTYIVDSDRYTTGFTDDYIQTTQTTYQYDENSFMEGRNIMLDVPFISQDNYPTGCELVSTSMLLAYYGLDISINELIMNYVELHDLYTNDAGMLCGYDPDEYFIGNPYDSNGYGCHSGVIQKALLKYLPSEEYKVHNLRGTPLEEICRSYIDYGVPVLIWASIDMKPTFRTENNSWLIEETGEYYTWTSNEHCLVLVGYDDLNYYFNDPLNNKNTAYEKSLVSLRYGELDMQAIAISR